MKRPYHPTLIGFFVLVALAFAVVMIISFGSGRFFSHRIPFVVVFPHSVNGLTVGSPVKFKGVPVGEVTHLAIRLDQEGNPRDIVVYCEFNRALITVVPEQGPSFLNEAVIRQAIQHGLRARCASDSFVTGQLYVDLDMYTNAPPPIYRLPNSPVIEIPTLYEGAAGFLQSLGRVNIRRLADQTEQILKQLNRLLAHVDVGTVTTSLVQTLHAIQDLAQSPSLQEAIRSFRQTMQQTDQVLQRMNTHLPSVSTNLQATLDRAQRTLEHLDQTLQELGRMASPSAPVLQQFQQALTEWTETARALRLLLEELEQNPSVILTGKPQKKP